MSAALPYPGLRPFRGDEADIFFGREEQTDQLLEKLDHTRFLAVVGPSGCGKSSLVRAGMIAALESGFMTSAGASWRIAIMRPGSHPVQRLAAALLEDSALGPERGNDPEALGFLGATLRRGPLGLVEALRETPLPDRTSLLLLVDQFEEIFRFGDARSRDEADAFVALLLETAAQREAPVYVVLTMRSDFLGDCASFTGLPEALNESQFLTPRLTRAQRRAAIVGPARVFGGDVEPALVNRLLNEMGDDPDQLPVLAHLLMRMWTRTASPGGDAAVPGDASRALLADLPPEILGRHLTLADYEAAGGFGGALSKHADEACRRLDAAGRRIAELTFRALCERGPGRRDIRHPRPVSEIAALAEVDVEDVIAVVEVFREPTTSFVVPALPEPLHPNTVLDISHEALIRQWRRLGVWVDREAASADTYRLLAQTAQRWREGKADLWGGLTLEDALEWKRRERPTSAWASRYGGDLDLALEFLAESEARRERERRAEEAARRAESRRSRAIAVASFIGFLAMAALAGWAVLERRNAKLAEGVAREHSATAEAQRNAAQMARFAESAARNRAEQARAAEAEARRKAEAARAAEAEARRSAERQAAAAEKAERWARAREIVMASLLDPDRHPERSALLALLGALQVRDIAGEVPSDVEDILYRMVQGLNVVAVLSGHEGGILDAAFGPDGKRVATVGRDGTARLWDAATGQALDWVVSREGRAFAVAFSPDGRRIAVGGAGGDAVVWDATSPSPVLTLPGHGDAVYALAYSADGRRLATLGADGRARVWDARRGTPLRVLETGDGASRDLDLSPDGSLVAAAGKDGKVRIWSVATGALEHTLEAQYGAVWAVGFSPDGARVATGGEDRVAVIWDARTGERRRELRGHVSGIWDVAFSADGKRLATASHDRTARVWEVDSGALVRVVGGHAGEVWAVGFSPDGRRLVTAGREPLGRIWDITPEGEGRYTGQAGPASDVEFGPAGRLLASAGMDGRVRVWTVGEGGTPRVLAASGASLFGLAISGDGERVAAGASDGRVVVWGLTLDTAQGPLATLEGHEGTVFAVDFAGAGSGRLASAGADGTVRIWSATGGEALHVIEAHSRHATCVVFDPAGRRVASGGRDGAVRIWDAETGEAVRELAAKGDEVWGLAWSPDGARLAAVGKDDVVRIWDAETGEVVRELAGHDNWVWDVEWSADGRRIATAGRDRTVRLWDAATGRVLRTLGGFTNDAFRVSFSPDGQRLATASLERKLRVDHVGIENLVNRARTRLTRALDDEECRRYLRLDACPPTVVASIVEARRLARTGDVNGALARFAEAERADPSLDLTDVRREAGAGLLARARDRAGREDFAGAAGAYREAARLDPALDREPEAWAREAAADVLVEQGRRLLDGSGGAPAPADVSLAVARLERAAELVPDGARVHFHLAEARRIEGDLEGAVAAYEVILRGESDLALLAHAGIAAAYAGLGRFEESVAAARRALAIAPGYAFAKGQLAWALAEQGKGREALAVVGEIDRDAPEHLAALDRIAFVTFEKVHGYAQANEIFTARRALQPRNRSFAADLAESHLAVERWDEAYALAERVISDAGAFDRPAGDSTRITMRFVKVAARVLARGRLGAREELAEFFRDFERLPGDFRSGWSYGGIEHWISGRAMDEADRRILLDLIRLLRAGPAGAGRG